MKRLTYILACVMALASCSERLPVGSVVDSCVYLLSPGETSVKIDATTEFIDIWVCKGGLDNKTYEVSFTIDQEDLVKYTAETHKTYNPLPGNSYELTKTTVTLDGDNIKGAARLSIDPLCIPAGMTFILPVRITCSSHEAVKSGADIQYLLINKTNN